MWCACQGVLQGTSAELRELAAEGLGELVDVTSPEALRPFVVQIAGPLIRIIGDRFPWEIKAAILAALGLLIQKAALGLKPFVPQLQTTFLKCLPDQVSTPDSPNRAEPTIVVGPRSLPHNGVRFSTRGASQNACFLLTGFVSMFKQ